MNGRAQLIDRLVAAQPLVRKRFVDAITPGLREVNAEIESITVHQLEVLRRVLDEEPMTMRDVAEVLAVGPSGATQLVDRLEQRGLVTRERDPSDRRVQRVIPTERARILGAQFHARMRLALDSVLSCLDEEELQTYVELAERVAGAQPASSRQPARRGG